MCGVVNGGGDLEVEEEEEEEEVITGTGCGLRRNPTIRVIPSCAAPQTRPIPNEAKPIARLIRVAGTGRPSGKGVDDVAFSTDALDPNPGSSVRILLSSTRMLGNEACCVDE